tara:strand:- start:1610 stop:1870 length:261 start_codon:yes stop_codon:yes gene_type:complete
MQIKMRLYSNQEILESWINGQKKQCATQYLSLDSDERKDFSTYCQEMATINAMNFVSKVYEYEVYIRILEYVIEYQINLKKDYYEY